MLRNVTKGICQDPRLIHRGQKEISTLSKERMLQKHDLGNLYKVMNIIRKEVLKSNMNGACQIVPNK